MRLFGHPFEFLFRFWILKTLTIVFRPIERLHEISLWLLLDVGRKLSFIVIFEKLQSELELFAKHVRLKIDLRHILELLLPECIVKFDFEWVQILYIVQVDTAEFLAEIVVLPTLQRHNILAGNQNFQPFRIMK